MERYIHRVQYYETDRMVYCFVNGEGRPIILRRQFPALDDLLRTLAAEHEKQQEAEA